LGQSNTLAPSVVEHVAHGTLRGLAYLHAETVGRDGHELVKATVVHRDFKSANVLLADDMTPRIADFGLAMQCAHGQTKGDAHGHVSARLGDVRAQQVGTRRYMAPEVLERATEFSALAYRQIDVYACSLVLWECMSRTQHCVDAPVPAYKLPFEVEVGTNPSMGEMCRVVCKQARRPVIPALWRIEQPVLSR